MTANTIRKTIFLKADKKRVWAYLTDPEKLAIWFHPPKVPLKAGEKLEMFGAESGDLLIWGEVLRADPYDALDYTFTVKPMNDAVSTVKWRLDAVAGGTRLSLVHEGLPETEEAFNVAMALDKGWDDHMGRMRADINA
ncbi:MAG: SRPBCC domain-containing protein [Rhodobacteraceae bacterium]|nr:SRPBCC domain-containing protein [Alphaproteobacteria bacterium]NNK66698.1 SRPBCC domain-containing protein [Paracoccaceae bacterium]